MDISVVIPTYNRGRWIAEAVNSVLRQSYAPREIIVVDDGSIDNTRDVLAEFGYHVKYYYKENGGVSSARNYGVLKAEGEWVAFLDSDDLWYPEKLSVQVRDLLYWDHSIAHVCNLKYSRDNQLREVNLFDHSGLRFSGKKQGNKMCIERPLVTHFKHWFVSTPAVLAKRSALLSAGLFNEGMSMFEDFDMWNRLALQGPWVVNQSIEGEVRRLDEGNLTALSYKERLNHDQVIVNILEELLLRSDLNPGERKQVRRKMGNYKWAIAKRQLGVGDLSQSAESVRQSIRLAPSMRSILRLLCVWFPLRVSVGLGRARRGGGG